MPPVPDRIDRRALLDAVAAGLEGVVDRAVARTREGQLGEYYAKVPIAALREGIRRDLRRAIRALVEERPLNDEDRAALGQIGDARARQGIPLEAMLGAYRVTIDEVFSELWRLADSGDANPSDVVLLARGLWRYADPVMDLAVQAYRHREVTQAVVDTQRRTALVHAILLSPPGAPADPLLTARLDPNGRYLALRARSLDGDTRGLLMDLETPGALDDATVAPHESDVIGFAARRPKIVPPAGVVIGIGPAGPLAELPRSLAIATRVVETAAAFGLGGVHALEDVGIAAIARSEGALGDALIARLVDRCHAQSAAGAELLDTVSRWLDCDLSVERTASALFVHPNTVRNRLRRYEQLTGADLRKVDDLLGVRLALLRARLRQRG